MENKGPLRRHPGLIPLSRDHHHGLVLAQLLKFDVPDYRGLPTTVEGKAGYALQFFRDQLESHFQKEETVLLPAVEGYDPLIDRYCEQIREEHRQISHIFNRWEHQEPNGGDLDELGRLLENHIRFEERVFFPRLQTSLPASLLDDLELD